MANAKDKGIFRNMVKYDTLDTNAFDRLFGIGWDVDSERVINNEQTVEFINANANANAKIKFHCSYWLIQKTRKFLKVY